MKDQYHIIVLEDNRLWIDGVRKRKPDAELIKAMQGHRKAVVKFSSRGYEIVSVEE